MWVTRFSRSCLFCMFIFRRLIFFPGYQYGFRIKFNFDSEYYDLSDISSKEPLFYHPLTETYIVGTPVDNELADIQIMILRRFDIEMSRFKSGDISYPEPSNIHSELIEKNIYDTYAVYYNKKYEVELRQPSYPDIEAKVLDRMGKIIRK